MISGFAKYGPRRPRKSALLSYLTPPVLAELRGEELVRFSNSGLAVSWVRVLNELGYRVDIIDWDDDSQKLSKDYDLVVLHGGKNFDAISKQLKPSTKIIHYLTGSYWKFNNSQEDQRLKNFYKRHNVQVERDRYIYADEDVVNEAAQGIIVLGDKSMKTTYPTKYKNVLTVNNASYPDTHFDKINKEYERGRNRFLFFAGSGNIHKGLDLVIEAFKDLDQELYIVTVLDREVLAVYKDVLKKPNIHVIGQVDMRSQQFYQIMDACAFVILPSCSEGQAGSVVECMNQGLIPIVSKETRLDAKQYGYILPDCRITTIQKTIETMSTLPAAKVASMSLKTRQVAKDQHSPEAFRTQLKQAILKLGLG